jgi:FkbM family methyltransferase
MLNATAAFVFPFGDGYWSKLLNRSFRYEHEFDLLLLNCRDVDYTLIDCGANFGYWSVLASSEAYGAHRAIAIEPSSRNVGLLRRNAEANDGRFDVMHAAIGGVRGVARLSGTKHEAFSIVGDGAAAGEDVAVVALDDLIDDGIVAPDGKFLVKLDVEGVETAAIEGAMRLAGTDAVFYCEEHGNDPHHTVSRFILGRTDLALVVHDPAQNRFVTLRTASDLALLDRIKVARHVGYNVFATRSPFWLDRFRMMNETASRRAA